MPLQFFSETFPTFSESACLFKVVRKLLRQNFNFYHKQAQLKITWYTCESLYTQMQSYYKKYIFVNDFHVYFQCFAEKRTIFFSLFCKFDLKKHAPKIFKQK